MDNNNWRPTPSQGFVGGGGEPIMDSVDWRTQLQPDSRHRIVNMIMETLKRHLPVSGQERLQELEKIAIRFEEQIYTAATSQPDYLQKISLKLLKMETKSQNPIGNPLPSNSAGNSNMSPDPVSLDSTAQTGHANGGDWQEEAYQKIRAMKDMYLPEISEVYLKIATKLQQNSCSNMLQQQHLKQQQEQKMMQTQHQQLKQQFQQRQMQVQLMQKQRIIQQQQQLHQQSKQQLSAQLQTHQMPQLHQINDPGVFQQHISGGRSAYQQLKPGASFSISSPQLLQAASPQIPQHSSPQVDQQNLLSSLTKAGTLLQSANSPFVVPSPSTPMAPSPMPGDSEKPVSGISSLSNAGNIGYQQKSDGAPAPSLAIGTSGISASPLLAEFTAPDGNHGNATMNVSGKSSITEQPLERLIKVVKSMSSKSLSASVSDISSVVSMIDRIAGSAPGNGSRAAVGEDLVAITESHLQARNYMPQDGSNGTRKMRPYTSAMPLNVVSSAGSMNDSFKQLTSSETSDLESTVTSSIKRPRIEV
ncbi:mediator of RNA polymerase II transcription subunit 15a-like isoform X5 [Fagus crenata]